MIEVINLDEKFYDLSLQQLEKEEGIYFDNKKNDKIRKGIKLTF